jgi:hypothetical protein
MNERRIDYSEELRSQPRFHAYVHKPGSRPINIYTEPPLPSDGTLQTVLAASRRRFARRR